MGATFTATLAEALPALLEEDLAGMEGWSKVYVG